MKTFLFDLDSTLLQMNQDEFVEAYFKSIARYSYTLGYNPKEFMEIFNKAAYAIIKNDGSMTNEDRFWMVIKEKYTDIDFLKKSFDHYYRNEFHELKDHIHKTYHPYELIKYLKDKGYRIILATNPVFPKVATEERMKWAGLSVDLFDDITTYENSRYCKPNHLYYLEILNKYSLKEEDCIMVGNDIDDDFSDLPNGIGAYFIKDYSINRKNKEITIPSFTMDEFLKYIKEEY